MRYKNDFRFGARRARGSFHRSGTCGVAFFLLISLLLVPQSSFADKYGKVIHAIDRRNEALQGAFLQFPLLTPLTNSDGVCRFQTIDLKKAIVSVDGVGFYGFRFKVPKRATPGDFVWAFGAPKSGYNWFILPPTEIMAGFADYFHQPRAAYEGLEHLFPTTGKQVVLQSLPGDELDDEKEYLIWFAFRSPKPSRLSLAFTFAKSQSEKSNRVAIEKTLGLKRKPKNPVNTEAAP